MAPSGYYCIRDSCMQEHLDRDCRPPALKGTGRGKWVFQGSFGLQLSYVWLNLKYVGPKLYAVAQLHSCFSVFGSDISREYEASDTLHFEKQVFT